MALHYLVKLKMLIAHVLACFPPGLNNGSTLPCETQDAHRACAGILSC